MREKGNIKKEESYKLQRKMSADKSNFSNEILYEIIVSEGDDLVPKLPKYIKDGLDWLACLVKEQIKGVIK